MKLRIIKRETVSGTKYVIQERHFLFKWWWVDAWMNSWDGAACIDSFNSYAEAQEHLKYFMPRNVTETVMKEINI